MHLLLHHSPGWCFAAVHIFPFCRQRKQRLQLHPPTLANFMSSYGLFSSDVPWSQMLNSLWKLWNLDLGSKQKCHQNVPPKFPKPSLSFELLQGLLLHNFNGQPQSSSQIPAILFRGQKIGIDQWGLQRTVAGQRHAAAAGGTHGTTMGLVAVLC